MGASVQHTIQGQTLGPGGFENKTPVTGVCVEGLLVNCIVPLYFKTINQHYIQFRIDY